MSARMPLSTLNKQSANGKRAQTATESQAPKYIVFKSSLRAKKLFQQYDTSKSGYLTITQFHTLLNEFLNSNCQQYNVTQTQLQYMFIDCDINHDDRISLLEFINYFVVHQSSFDFIHKSTGIIYKPLIPSDTELISCNDMLAMIESLYMYNIRSYRDVDLTNTKKCTSLQLKKLLNSIVLSESNDAKLNNRVVKSWAVHAVHKGGITQQESDLLYNHLSNNKHVKSVDLTIIFDRVKQLTPPVTNQKTISKSKSATANKKIHKIQLINGLYEIYNIKSVSSDLLNDFINDQLYNNIMKSNTQLIYKCHPVLTHWGTDICIQHGLSHTNTGYKQYILHSNRTKYKQCIKFNDCIRLYATCRISYTYLCYIEQLYHCCITLDHNEAITNVECKLKRSWLDGEIDEIHKNDVIDKWSAIVINDQDYNEVSIPLCV